MEERVISIAEQFLNKGDVANRYDMSRTTIDTLCSRSPESLPPFFKLGNSKNSPIRFRLSDCIEWEKTQLKKQRLLQKANAPVSLESLANNI